MIHDANLSRKLAWRSGLVLAVFGLMVMPLSLVGAQNDGTKQREEPVAWASVDDRDFEQKIRGTVVDAEGRPIDGARLWHRYGLDNRQHEWLYLETRSDKRGGFEFQVPRLNEFQRAGEAGSEVWAYAPGYRLATAVPGKGDQKGRDATDLRIEMEPPTDTSFVVRDPHGEPVPDALVQPSYYRTSQWVQFIPDGIKQLLSKRTDAQGRVPMFSTSRDRLNDVEVTTEDYGLQSIQLGLRADAPPVREIDLRPVARIRGRITADNQDWVRDVRLRFETTGGFPIKPTRTSTTKGVAQVTTDESGEFEVPVIAEGELRITHAPFAEDFPARPLLPLDEDLKAGTTIRLEIPMQRLVEVHGSIIAADSGEGMPGIKIHIYYGGFRQGTDVISDEEGRFSASVLPGQVRFQVMNIGQAGNYLHLPWNSTQEVPDGATSLELDAIELVPSKPLDGRLVDHDGVPISGASVSAVHQNRICSRAETEQNGAFELPKIPATLSPSDVDYSIRVGRAKYRTGDDAIIQQESPFVLQVELDRDASDGP